MNYNHVSKSEQFVNELPEILTGIGNSLKNSAVKKGLLWLSRDEVFTKILKDFLYDPKLVRTDEDIHNALKLWCSNRDEAIIIYGHISYWDTSLVKYICSC